MSLSIVRLPRDGGRQTVTFLGSFDLLVDVFKSRQAVKDKPQWHPEFPGQIVYIRVMFSIANHHLDEVDGIWVSGDNKIWNCVLNRENHQVGNVDIAGGKVHYYLAGAPACLQRAIQGALERATMRRLSKDPEAFPRTRRGEGQ